MGNWIKTGEHDWRDQRHNLAYYGVEVYLNLDTGENRYVYKDTVYIYDKDAKRYVELQDYLVPTNPRKVR